MTLVLLGIIGWVILYFVITQKEEKEEPSAEDKFLDSEYGWQAKISRRADWHRYENCLFCKKCYLHDYWFVGGGSWAPDGCPICGGTACVEFKDIPNKEKNKAIDEHLRRWKEKYGCYPYERS